MNFIICCLDCQGCIIVSCEGDKTEQEERHLAYMLCVCDCTIIKCYVTFQMPLQFAKFSEACWKPVGLVCLLIYGKHKTNKTYSWNTLSQIQALRVDRSNWSSILHNKHILQSWERLSIHKLYTTLTGLQCCKLQCPPCELNKSCLSLICYEVVWPIYKWRPIRKELMCALIAASTKGPSSKLGGMKCLPTMHLHVSWR